MYELIDIIIMLENIIERYKKGIIKNKILLKEDLEECLQLLDDVKGD